MQEFANQLFISLVTNPIYITVVILGLICLLFYSKIVGWFGELWTKQSLMLLSRKTYKVLHNIMIDINGVTHQIDHIVVSPYGIFVIETKQYNGYITGNKYDKKWVRHLGKKKIYYENPIRQNYGHVLALCELLKLDESKVFNIVCIPSNAKLKIKDDGETQRNITIVGKIISYKNPIINNIDGIVDIIKTNNIKDCKRRKQHIKNIKNNIIKNDLIDCCPKCGGTLVERESKYGKFIGCSNYPRCKYIKK